MNIDCRSRQQNGHGSLVYLLRAVVVSYLGLFMGSLTEPVMAGPAPAASTAPSPTQCGAPEHRQFDFWIGKWDVTNTKDRKPAGSSLIESLYDGCAVRENWSETGFSGGSLNTYNATDRLWHQMWTDSSGAWREYIGGLQDGRIVLIWRYPSVRDPSKTVQVRMTFTPNADGSVRQYSDQSIDGTNWIERYDYTYRRAKS